MSATGGWIERRSRPVFVLGLLASFAAILLIGETLARFSPPGDIRISLGLGPAQNGIYRPDPQLGADYRSYEDFHAENAARLAELGALNSPTPTWLLFGNSFVQAPGMLAETARAALPDKRIFDLRQNVLLPLRAAQARLLLGAGLRPQRIFFVLLPVDLLQIGNRPLSYIAVNSQGAIATRLRFPDAPWHYFVVGSRLATIAWIRSGSADGDPSFKRSGVAGTPSSRMREDLARIFSHLGETSRRYGIPVTIVTMPNREQIFGRAGFEFQEAVKELSRDAKFDYYDASGPFLQDSDKRSLFLPDWHFNERGNALLLRGLLAHLDTSGSQSGSPKAP